ncbi:MULTISPECIES: lipid-A-disaccharide synthase [unclassified Ruegeria]|uniref:lipid-A-disaccharide synthase n=1 Tax=unclassified Ruegeria TaxID=2625375 RepID=UPI001AEB2FE9|nr:MULTISPECIES: lipid-A-disaccharide synthase [unclassified Ruegeria]
MRVFLVAGEPSGDRLGGALMEGLKTLIPDIEFDGVGGPLMAAQGLTSRFPMSELSVMGLIEVLPKFFHLKRRISETAQAVLDTQPDVLITIDSPDFSLRVAKVVKAASDIRTVHYVAPSVWAWRPGRADKMAKVIDHVLALLPFEPPYMERAGMECDFVGHPVASEPTATPAEISAFRSKYDLGDAPILLALPGSRRGEIERLADTFGEALQLFLKDHPSYRVVVPTVGATTDLVNALTQNWPGAPKVLDPRQMGARLATVEKRAAFGTACIALAASGTVSLELAAQNTPMVIAYKLNWLTQKMAERMVKLDTVTLVNLVSETRAVPECLLNDCQPEMIAKALHDVTNAPDAQKLAMNLTMERLGRGGDAPGLRAARAVLDRMQIKNA